MQTATDLEKAKLIEAAFRSSNPQAFLCGIQSAFRLAGRYGDFLTAAELGELFRAGEIERLMYLKAEWWAGNNKAK